MGLLKSCTFLLSLLFAFPESYGKELTLQDYLSEVRKNNPTIRSSISRAKALEHRTRPSGTLEDPFIGLGVDEVPFEGGMEYVKRYQISQTIPFPGKLSARSSIAQGKANSAKSDTETVSREITVLATQAFFRLYFNQKALELNERVKKIIEGTVGSTKARYRTGESNHHEWLLAQIELSVFEIERIRLLREQKTFRAQVNELRDQSPDFLIDSLTVHFSSEDIREGELPSLKNQPELKSLDFFVSQVEAERDLAKLSYFPDFVFQGMAMFPSPDMMDEKANWGIMIGINIPLYFWRKQSEISSAAILEKEAATLEKRNIENRLRTEALDAQEQFKAARDVVTLYKETLIPITNLAVQNAKSAYTANRLPLARYLDTIRVQRTQELEYLAAQIDVELARTRLKELLSAPPILRFAPAKPSLFGGGQMGSMSMGSDAINMGRGMSGPSKKTERSTEPDGTGSSGMGNM